MKKINVTVEMARAADGSTRVDAWPASDFDTLDGTLLIYGTVTGEDDCLVAIYTAGSWVAVRGEPLTP